MYTSSAQAAMLRDIPGDFLWHREAPDGQLVFAQAKFTPVQVLSPSARVALAMNEVCREMRRGKVYTMVRHPPDALTQENISSAEAFVQYPSTVLQSMPELFYVPEAWSDRHVLEWDGMTAMDRLHRVCGRYGWVDDCVPVLPFNLWMDERFLSVPYIGPPNECPITVLIVPRPYAAFTQELRDLFHLEFRVNQDKMPTRVRLAPNAGVGWDRLEQWRRPGLKGILDWLQERYWDGSAQMEGCTMSFAALDEWICTRARGSILAPPAKSGADKGGTDGGQGSSKQEGHGGQGGPQSSGP